MQLLQLLESNEPVVCVIQGGGMRGTYSIAILSKLEEIGLTNRFNCIYGTSAGALNGAYFLAGQAADGVSIYVDHLSGNRFINYRRIRPIIDIDYLVDDVMKKQVPLDIEAVLASETKLYAFTTDTEKGRLVRFSNKDECVDLFEVLRATASLPIVFGKEVVIGNNRFCDGGLIDSLPIMEAITDGWKNIFVIITRPLSYRSRSVSWLASLGLKGLAKFAGHSTGVVRLLGDRDDKLNTCMDMLSGKILTPEVRLWAVSPSNVDRLVSRLTNDRMSLNDTANLAREDIKTALRSDEI